MPSAQAQGRARSSGRFRHSPTEANAFSLRSGTAAVAMPGPRRISETSSILLVETPARCISIIASSTEDSRLRQCPMAAVARRAPLSLGMWMVASPELVAGPRP